MMHHRSSVVQALLRSVPFAHLAKHNIGAAGGHDQHGAQVVDKETWKVRRSAGLEYEVASSATVTSWRRA
jgi:hypothetical protein